MKDSEILAIMATAENIEEWNQLRAELFLKADKKKDKALEQRITTLVDCQGLINKVLKTRYQPKNLQIHNKVFKVKKQDANLKQPNKD